MGVLLARLFSCASGCSGLMNTQKTVTVLGGGFAGAFAAKRLRKVLPADVEVELVSERNYFVFQPLLPEVVGGTITATDAVTPLRLMLKDINVRMGEVMDIDFANKKIELAQGSGRIPQFLSYDALVMALGTRGMDTLFPGLADHGFFVKNLTDAQQLRNHVIHCLEHADVTRNAQLKSQLLTFVIAGGGFSGVEVAGEVQELIARSLRHYPNISKDELKILLVHSGKEILPELSERLGAHARERLVRRGVEFLLETRLAGATAMGVETSAGDFVGSHTLICTIGNGPVELLEHLPLTLERGQIAVDANLQVEGQEGVWALGDNARVPLDDGSFAPTTAQFAVREAELIATNVAAWLQGQSQAPFSYEPKGSMASIGHYDAVAEVYGRPLSGVFAWLLWRGFYWSLVPSVSTRLRIALNWLFDYVLPRSIVQISAPDDTGLSRRHYKAGDVLFDPGQHIDGLYTVVSGRLESRILRSSGDSGEADHVRLIGVGEHWGEHSLSKPQATIGRLVALEDSEVLLIRRADFTRLSAALPFFQTYFDELPEARYPEELQNNSN